MFFKIDKLGEEPVYAQLIWDVKDKIKRNELPAGHKMPPERELAQSLGISRGTVRKAYDILIQERILDAVQGSGTYVSKNAGQNKVSAREKISGLLDLLFESGYSSGEIESMFSISLKNRRKVGIKAAAIECNEETLAIIEKQLQYLNLSLEHFLLEDVLNFKKGDELFENFELIFTTTTHFDKLDKALPKSYCEGKITRIAVSADFETIMDINSLGSISQGDFGIVTKSKRFADIIEHNLKNFDISVSPDDRLLLKSVDDEQFEKFIESRRCIILPPIYTVSLSNSMNNLLLNYYKNGGKIIIFNYLIEKGSLLHLEEFIQKGGM